MELSSKVKTITKSWTTVRTIATAETIGAMLFHRLFLLDPSLLHFFSFTSNFDVHQLSKDLDTPNEELFKNAEFVEHAKIVVGAVDMLVKNLSDLTLCFGILNDLGERHQDYGVTIPNYDSLGVALLGTLKTGLGEKWGDKEEESWTWLWGVIKENMTKGY